MDERGKHKNLLENNDYDLFSLEFNEEKIKEQSMQLDLYNNKQKKLISCSITIYLN